MIYLISIINIAEIILAVLVIVAITRCDNKIVKINTKLLENRYKIKIVANKIQEATNKAYKFVKKSVKSAQEKQMEIINGLIKNIAMSLAVMFLPKSIKKKLIAIELIGLIISTYKKQSNA